MGTILNETEHLLIESTQVQTEHGSNTNSFFQRTCSESKKLWHIAGPSILTRLAMFSITVVTQSFAGHLGDLDLAAISIACTVLISITFGFLLGMASALETLCGQAYGAGQHRMLSVYLQRSWVVMFLSSILMLPVFIFATPVLKLIGQPVAVAEQAGLENFYYRLLLIVSGYMHNSEIAIDALSVCVTIYGWESMIPLAFLGATGVRVANELGAGNAKGAKFACAVSVATTVVVGFIFWLIIVAFNKNLALIFTSSSSVIQMVNELAMLLAFTVLINCIQPVLSGVAVGSGRQAIVAYINIGSYYLVGIPLGVLLGWLLPSGIVGMWIGMMSGTVVQTLILIIITMKYDWEKEVRKAQILIKEEATSNQ